MASCMSRLAETFARTRAQNRAAFVAYVCAGDPDFDTSLAACRALLANGVDVLELMGQMETQAARFEDKRDALAARLAARG